MKKFLSVILLVVAFVALIACPVVAETVASEPAVFDWTGIITAGIALVAAAVVALLTWLKKKYPVVGSILEAATIAVRAAEKAFGRFHGAEKLQMALEALKGMGLNIDSKVVLDAVDAAWVSLNNEQIAAGIKGADGTDSPVQIE